MGLAASAAAAAAAPEPEPAGAAGLPPPGLRAAWPADGAGPLPAAAWAAAGAWAAAANAAAAADGDANAAAAEGGGPGALWRALTAGRAAGGAEGWLAPLLLRLPADEGEDGGGTRNEGALAPFLGPAAELVLGAAGARSDPAAWLAATLPGLAATVREYLLAELVGDAAAVARVLARLPAAGPGSDDVPPALHVLELAAPRGGEAAARGAELLYSSRRHGRSLSRLAAKCDGYAGDLVVLLETAEEEAEAEAEGALLAACRGGLEGGSVAALVEAGPSVSASVDGGGGVVLRTRRRRARGSSHEALGVGFGGSAAAPTWWVDEDFKAVACRSFPRPGVTRRKVAAVSAWGLGGAAAAQAQAAAKEREQRFLEQRRQVDLKKLAQEWKGGGGDAWLLQAAGHAQGGAAGEVVRGVRQEERQLRQEQQRAG